MDRPTLIAPRGLATDVWQRLMVAAEETGRHREPAHDIFHVHRVVRNARRIVRAEHAGEGSEAIACTAALLHELFTFPKDHPESARAGDVCAEHARRLLERERMAKSFVDAVCAAIRDHAFSKGAVPDSLEAKILQDADRLDALGAIGLARMWATCADMKRPFYSPVDPFCQARSPDDKAWGLDHVFRKLLVLGERLHTDTARAMAERRLAFLRAYLLELRVEIEVEDEGGHARGA